MGVVGGIMIRQLYEVGVAMEDYERQEWVSECGLKGGPV